MKFLVTTNTRAHSLTALKCVKLYDTSVSCKTPIVMPRHSTNIEEVKEQIRSFKENTCATHVFEDRMPTDTEILNMIEEHYSISLYYGDDEHKPLHVYRKCDAIVSCEKPLNVSTLNTIILCLDSLESYSRSLVGEYLKK